MLREEAIQVQMCKNPDVKCAVVERAHRTLREMLDKYYTYKNTYRYIDVLPNFKPYNETVPSTTGLVPSRVIDAEVLAIWLWKQAKWRRFRITTARGRVGRPMRMSVGSMKFSKVAGLNFSTEIFRILKVFDRRPRTVYELDYLYGTPIDGQFCQEELTPLRITSRTDFKIDKIL